MQDCGAHRPCLPRQLHRALHRRPARRYHGCHGEVLALGLPVSHRRRMRAAARRLRLHDGVSDRPNVGRQPRAAYLRGSERNHEGADRVLAVNDTLCLHQLIEQQAQRTPDQVALVFEQWRLTYRELNRCADQLARHLRTLNGGPETLVGLFVERSLEMVVGILGVLKAGAAYVPIDAANPQERIAFVLTDANVTVLLTQTSLVANLPTGTPIVCLDSFQWTPKAFGEEPSDVQVDSDNLAYVIYTSGSTGRPKGVCIEHRSIVNYVMGVAERLQLTPGLHHATVSTIAADLGNTVIFPALTTGGCLHIISQERAESQ